MITEEQFQLSDLKVKDLVIYKGRSVKDPSIKSEKTQMNPTPVVKSVLKPGEHILILGFGREKYSSDEGMWVKVLGPNHDGWLYLSSKEHVYRKIVNDPER